MTGRSTGWLDRIATYFVSLSALVSLLCAGCETADRTRENLKEQQLQWQSRLSQQRGIHAQAEGRLARFPVGEGDERDAASVRRRQVDALISANRQTLNDFEIQIQQARSEVEAGIKEGGTAGADALERVSGRMARYVYAQDENLTAASVALARLEQGAEIGNAQ
jgi:hypothetical protein